MGTLASELGPVAARLTDRPRLYADANVPAGLVEFMRARLAWDVFFVMEHDDLRRAADDQHYRLARQLHRTLLTLDRDYLDDERFPPAEGGGVLVVSAPHEEQMTRLLRRLDRALFQRLSRAAAEGRPPSAMPLLGRKLHAQADWTDGALRP
jgi:hypothetical protein